MRLSAGGSGGLLGLEVLVGEEGSGTTEDDDGVEADAETGGSASLGSGSESTGKGSLGLGVTGLFVEKSNVSVGTVLSSHANSIRKSHACRVSERGSHLTWRFRVPTRRGSRASRASSE